MAELVIPANAGNNNNSSLNPIIVQERVISQYAERENFFSRYMGESPSSVIQVVNDLANRPGDSVRVHVFSKLGSPGVDGDATLEGQESALSYNADLLLLGQKRQAVRLAGRLTEQRSAIDLRKQAGHALGVWAKDWVTELLTVYLAGFRGSRTLTVLPPSFGGFAGNALRAPDPAHRLIAGAGTAPALTTADKMTCALLDKAITKVQLLINTGVPMRAIDAQGRFLCIITPEQAYDLWQDADFVAAQQYAQVRGDNNPLFTGMMGMWKNLIIVVNPAGVLLPQGADLNPAGSPLGTALLTNSPAAQAQILGAQSGAWVKGKEEGASMGGAGSWRYTEKEFDFDNQIGFAVATLMGFQKLQFANQDHGAFSVFTAYTSV
jgi:N4-gp56 family major capsid protein